MGPNGEIFMFRGDSGFCLGAKSHISNLHSLLPGASAEALGRAFRRLTLSSHADKGGNAHGFAQLHRKLQLQATTQLPHTNNATGAQGSQTQGEAPSTGKETQGLEGFWQLTPDPRQPQRRSLFRGTPSAAGLSPRAEGLASLDKRMLFALAQREPLSALAHLGPAGPGVSFTTHGEAESPCNSAQPKQDQAQQSGIPPAPPLELPASAPTEEALTVGKAKAKFAGLLAARADVRYELKPKPLPLRPPGATRSHSAQAETAHERPPHSAKGERPVAQKQGRPYFRVPPWLRAFGLGTRTSSSVQKRLQPETRGPTGSPQGGPPLGPFVAQGLTTSHRASAADLLIRRQGPQGGPRREASWSHPVQQHGMLHATAAAAAAACERRGRWVPQPCWSLLRTHSFSAGPRNAARNSAAATTAATTAAAPRGTYLPENAQLGVQESFVEQKGFTQAAETPPANPFPAAAAAAAFTVAPAGPSAASVAAAPAAAAAAAADQKEDRLVAAVAAPEAANSEFPMAAQQRNYSAAATETVTIVAAAAAAAATAATATPQKASAAPAAIQKDSPTLKLSETPSSALQGPSPFAIQGCSEGEPPHSSRSLRLSSSSGLGSSRFSSSTKDTPRYSSKARKQWKVFSLPRPLRLKVVTIGPEACGKSCLVRRFCERRFAGAEGPLGLGARTIASDFGLRDVKLRSGESVRLHFVDLSGAPMFAVAGEGALVGADVVMCVFDAVRGDTLDEAIRMMHRAEREAGPDALRVLVAAKLDGSAAAAAAVAAGAKAAAAAGALFYAACAETAEGVDALFLETAAAAAERIKQRCALPAV